MESIDNIKNPEEINKNLEQQKKETLENTAKIKEMKPIIEKRLEEIKEEKLKNPSNTIQLSDEELALELLLNQIEVFLLINENGIFSQKPNIDDFSSSIKQEQIHQNNLIEKWKKEGPPHCSADDYAAWYNQRAFLVKDINEKQFPEFEENFIKDTKWEEPKRQLMLKTLFPYFMIEGSEKDYLNISKEDLLFELGRNVKSIYESEEEFKNDAIEATNLIKKYRLIKIYMSTGLLKDSSFKGFENTTLKDLIFFINHCECNTPEMNSEKKFISLLEKQLKNKNEKSQKEISDNNAIDFLEI